MQPVLDNNPISPIPPALPTPVLRFPAIARFISISLTVLKVLIGSYGLSLLLFLLLRIVIGESWVMIAIFNTFAHLLLIPALFVLPILLLARQWRMAIIFVPIVLSFLFHYGALFLANPVELADTAKRIPILSYNVLATNRTPEGSIEIIKSANADIVTLQEVSPNFAILLQTELDYPYTAIHAGGERPTMGQAVLSRYPILEDEYWIYDWLPIPLGHQRVALDVDGVEVVIYNVHPAHPGMTNSFFNATYRRREIESLLERIAQETAPLIMIGDFNLTDLTEDYGRIRAHLIDSWYEVGQGMGMTFPDFQSAALQDSARIFPDSFPNHLATPLFLRLDYAFHSEAFTATRMYIWDKAGGSDHRPLFVELALSAGE